MKGTLRKIVAVGAMALLIILLFLATATPAMAATSLSLGSGDISVISGDTITLPLVINDAVDVAATEIWLHYNKDVVAVNSVANGNLDQLSQQIDNPNGVTKLIYLSQSGTGQSGNLTMANVTLKAVGQTNTSCTLSIEIKTIKNSALADITYTAVDRSLTITGGSKDGTSGQAGGSSASTTSPGSPSGSSSGGSSSGSFPGGGSSASSSEDTNRSAPIALIVVAGVCPVLVVLAVGWLLLRRSRIDRIDKATICPDCGSHLLYSGRLCPKCGPNDFNSRLLSVLACDDAKRTAHKTPQQTPEPWHTHPSGAL